MSTPRQYDLVRLERPGHIVEARVDWVNPRSGALSLERFPEPFIPSEWEVTVVQTAAERSLEGLQRLADAHLKDQP